MSNRNESNPDRAPSLQTSEVGTVAKYPEHEKMSAVKSQAQIIGDFLEWLESEGRSVAAPHRHTRQCDGDTRGVHECGMKGSDTREPLLAMPALYTWEPPQRGNRIERILAAYFEIDLAAIAREKDEMYRAVVETNVYKRSAKRHD